MHNEGGFFFIVARVVVRVALNVLAPLSFLSCPRETSASLVCRSLPADRFQGKVSRCRYYSAQRERVAYAERVKDNSGNKNRRQRFERFPKDKVSEENLEQKLEMVLGAY